MKNPQICYNMLKSSLMIKILVNAKPEGSLITTDINLTWLTLLGRSTHVAGLWAILFSPFLVVTVIFLAPEELILTVAWNDKISSLSYGNKRLWCVSGAKIFYLLENSSIVSLKNQRKSNLSITSAKLNKVFTH